MVERDSGVDKLKEKCEWLRKKKKKWPAVTRMPLESFAALHTTRYTFLFFNRRALRSILISTVCSACASMDSGDICSITKLCVGSAHL